MKDKGMSKKLKHGVGGADGDAVVDMHFPNGLVAL